MIETVIGIIAGCGVGVGIGAALAFPRIHVAFDATEVAQRDAAIAQSALADLRFDRERDAEALAGWKRSALSLQREIDDMRPAYLLELGAAVSDQPDEQRVA